MDPGQVSCCRHGHRSDFDPGGIQAFQVFPALALRWLSQNQGTVDVGQLAGTSSLGLLEQPKASPHLPCEAKPQSIYERMLVDRGTDILREIARSGSSGKNCSRP